jgi:hypothetical protein
MDSASELPPLFVPETPPQVLQTLPDDALSFLDNMVSSGATSSSSSASCDQVSTPEDDVEGSLASKKKNKKEAGRSGRPSYYNETVLGIIKTSNNLNKLRKNKAVANLQVRGALNANLWTEIIGKLAKASNHTLDMLTRKHNPQATPVVYRELESYAVGIVRSKERIRRQMVDKDAREVRYVTMHSSFIHSHSIVFSVSHLCSMPGMHSSSNRRTRLLSKSLPPPRQ